MSLFSVESSLLHPNPTSPLRKLTELPTLDQTTVEAALVDLLDAVRRDEIPPSARCELHRFYDRFQAWRHHFLHHFAPFVCDVDQVFQVRAASPVVGSRLWCWHSGAPSGAAWRDDYRIGQQRGPRQRRSGDDRVVRVSRGTAQPDVRLLAEDAFTWLTEQPAGSFDGCYTQFALAYMRPHARMLELIDRVIRPGGRIVFREFNAGSLYNRLIAKVDWLTDNQYQQVGRQLGWHCRRREHYWILPRQVVNWAALRRGLGPLEQRLTALPRVGAQPRCGHDAGV